MADEKVQSKYTPTRTEPETQVDADPDVEAVPDDEGIFTSKYTPTAVIIVPEGLAATARRPKPVRRNHKATITITFDPPAPADGTGKQRVLFTCLDGSDAKSVLNKRHIDVPVAPGDVTVSGTVKVDQNAPLNVEVLALAVTDGIAVPTDTMVVT